MNKQIKLGFFSDNKLEFQPETWNIELICFNNM